MPSQKESHIKKQKLLTLIDEVFKMGMEEENK